MDCSGLRRRSPRLASVAAARDSQNVAPITRKKPQQQQQQQEQPQKKKRALKSSSDENAGTIKPLKRLPSRELQIELWRLGYLNVVGVDEAGRGPLAGPVVAAACMIPSGATIEGIDDSKKLTAEKREQVFQALTSTPGVLFAVCIVDAARIDEINILQATMQAMLGCIEKLGIADDPPCYVLIDGNRLPDGLPSKTARCVVNGDAKCQVIAAASIVAKVTRDRLMLEYDERWPAYGFKNHKGYGTAAHTAALNKHGPCEIHRRSFAPLKLKTTTQ